MDNTTNPNEEVNAAEESQSMADFEAYDKSFKTLRSGEFLTGRVVKVDDSEGIYVDVGYKTEGLVPLAQISHQKNVVPSSIVKVGDEIKKGQTVAILEAMKLENEVVSTVSGKVLEIKVSKGQQVNNKQVLLVVG